MIESEAGFLKLIINRKSGTKRFHQNNQLLDLKLLNFWQWAASDLIDNVTRGVLAEYIVASALGVADGVRASWDAFDLVTQSGVKVEVKSAAYLQAWYHKKLSVIKFGIRPTRMWDASTNKFSTELKRQADIYVFCILNHKEEDTLDPLNLDQWSFYVIHAAVLDEKFPTQKSIGLASLLRLNPCAAKYAEIGACIEKLSHVKSAI